MTACTQEELTDSDALPEGRYPVEIASVSIGGESSVQPWGARSPQTRMVESSDGENSLWQWNGEIFYVKFYGDNKQKGKYRLHGAQEMATDSTLYWRSKTDTETIISYFTQPQTDNGGTMDLASQTKDKPAYVCRSKTYAKCGDKVELEFKHQLAQVKVYVQGTGYEGNVTGVTINNVHTSCTVTDGIPAVPNNAVKGSIPMFSSTVNNAVCFKANILPGTVGGKGSFTVTLKNGSTPTRTFDVDEFVAEGGKVYTVNLRLQKTDTQTIDLSEQADVYTINDSKTYFLYCSKASNEHGIKVTGGNPTIYLANVNLNVADGNAIDLHSNATLVIQGNDSIKSANGAGIFVASGKTVTIQSSDRSDNVLTVQAGGEAAGIGGSANTNCGNITIKDIRLYAYGSSGNSGACPGIGGAGSGECGTIKIQDSYVYAYGSAAGNNHAPAIGSAQPASGELPYAPRCEFSGSTSYNDCTIHAYRGGSNADYIGQGGTSSKTGGRNFGGGWFKNGRLYAYTGNSGSEDMGQSKVYDASGNEI